MTDDSAPASHPVWALLVGIDEYDGGVRNLRGCVNDVRAMHRFLTGTLGVPPSQIRVLTSPAIEPDGLPPTRATIIQSFREFLIENEAILEGAHVLFQYSGHGSQMPDWTGTEPDGKNETLVATDSRLPGNYDLPDKTLAAMLERLAERRGAANITVILDSCHSGSATRDPALEDIVSTRFQPADERVPPPELDAEWVQVDQQRERGSSGWARARTEVPYVLLAGCRDSEESAEMTILMEREDGSQEQVTHGAMSYFLIRALTNKLAPGTTYRDLHEEVAVQVNARYPKQMPQCEGQRDRTVFEGVEIRRDPFISVRDIHKGELTLDGGLLRALRPGTRLALYPPDVKTEEEASGHDPLATTEVITANATSAQARIVEQHEEIPQFARGLITEHVHPGAALRVALHAPPDDDGNPVAANERAIDRLRQSIQGTGGNASPYLSLVEGEGAEVHVRAEQDHLRVFDAEGELLLRPSDIGDSGDAQQVRHALESIARWRGLLALTNEQPSVYDGKVRVQLRRRGDDTLLEPVDGEGVTLDYDPDDETQNIYVVEVINDSPQPCFPHIFIMSADYSITQLYPSVGQQEALPPGHTLRSVPAAGGSELEIWLPGAEEGEQWDISRDFIKVIATEKAADLSVLEQQPLEVPPPRGDTRGRPNTALEDLVDAVAAGEGTRLGRRRERAGEEWVTVNLPLTVVRASTTRALAAGEERVTLADDLTLIKPVGMVGSVSVGTLDQSTRGSAGDPTLQPPPSLANSPDFQPLARAGTRGLGSEALVLTFEDIDDDSRVLISPDNPMRLELSIRSAAEPTTVLPVFFDGEDYLIAGRSVADGSAVEITHMPEGAPTTRGLGRTVRLFLYKKSGRPTGDIGLRRAQMAADGTVRYDAVSPDQVQPGERVALFIHGFTSDTAWMITGPAQLLEKQGFKYDHLLTWDYESFGTSVADNGEKLATALRQQAGFSPADDITVDVFAHSMGGFVTRCMVELSGGHELVDRAIFAGAPSNGTTLASLAHGGAFILSAALNQTAIPIAGGVGKLLDAFREQGEGLADIRVDSPLVRRLNALSQPSTVEYFVLAGENRPDPRMLSRAKRLAQKLLDRSLDALFGEQNDVVIGFSSMTGVRGGAYPKLEITPVPSDHFTYFNIPETRDALRSWLG